MSGRGKQIEEEEGNEREMLHHWSHEHPLTLVKTREKVYCYGCEELFSVGDQAYGCITKWCNYSNLLHEECAAIAREIRHPSHHPQHILIQHHEWELGRCRICQRLIWSIGYRCSVCDFQMHLRCAQGGGMVDATGDDDDDKRHNIIHHPSHPDHELKLLRRRCPFKCDACGTTRKDSSYTCTNDACEYWIHEKCASLPQSFKREDHHHSLSLSFRVPFEYLDFNYKCDVCNKYLLPNYWIYHCQICRFIVHVKCVFNKQSPVTEYIGKDIIHLPANEVAEELITPFVMGQTGGGGGTLIPPIIIPAAAVDELMKVKYKFLHHQHQLTLVSSGERSQEEEEEEEEEEEDEENYGVRSEFICDGCITPISSYYYMSCSECKYNLHLACFHLPPQLSSHPLHQHDDHQLVLRSCHKHQPWNCQYCSVCEYETNGLFYSCIACDFKVDIQCGCMPDTIHHAAHPRHLLKHVTYSVLRRNINPRRVSCAAGCDDSITYYDCYRCSNNSCDFIVHVKCALLPVSVSSRRWDEHHTLLLTYDATLNRPGDFYCDQCETQMHPRSWMYHCRPCDISFHPKCFPTTSGYYRNRKLGQEYHVNDAVHQHPLTFQLLTTKLCCDSCGEKVHGEEGFYCALCNFFICRRYRCGEKMIENGDMKAVD
ncbi:uncharacterized protein LOC125207007 [Salvia hispanica]|uniref:uncharacterized protein LOC125207007 n=1 Tax=Salvia hispanica TaxID=49212 RepID=UPI00200992CE|nr:uncharacterized protein LOC125207007 [Salvia hispanica]